MFINFFKKLFSYGHNKTKKNVVKQNIAKKVGKTRKTRKKIGKRNLPLQNTNNSERQGVEVTPALTRAIDNPVLSPREGFSWEVRGAFNPAALYLGGRVHLLYRAEGEDGQSVLGYASSEDGIFFDERLEYPVYVPRSEFEKGGNVPDDERLFDPEKYTSGGGWCGCEDPKLTQIGDRVFLTYVAFAGWESVRVAMSSISVEDFLAKRWKWTLPVLCTEPSVTEAQRAKSGGLFPEKINGKYLFYFRAFPHIFLDYVEDLRFGKDRWAKRTHTITTGPKGQWDHGKISFGATPIKTKAGWLVITHGVNGRQENAHEYDKKLAYRMGAMLLDLKDPTKVIYRTPEPILEPELWYEHNWKPDVVYPCGAVVKDGTLLVYYGGGDMYTCVASAPLDEFIKDIMEDKTPKLKHKKTINKRFRYKRRFNRAKK